MGRSANLQEYSWLAVVATLWDCVCTKRDDSLVLPTADCPGAIELQAQYSDCQALNRHLLSHLTDASGQPFLSAEFAASCWLEHDDRATLPTFIASLTALPSDWSGDLGGWSSKSSVGYIRSQLRRVAFMQSELASHIRGGKLSLEALREGDLMAQWAHFMCDRGDAHRRGT